MAVIYDPAKDAENRRKHGISLVRTSELDIRKVLPDERRDYGEPRLRAFGFIDGKGYCLVFTPRGVDVRAISLRRSHAKELRLHLGPSTEGST
jgi:uncharacterized DUF497 family protein